jgi:eukaryotic translation initiation factor 2C
LRFRSFKFEEAIEMSATGTLKRPGYGKQGKIIQLKSNFFRVSFPSTDVFAYNFKTEPICTALTKRLLWAKIKEEVADKSTVAGMIYDCQTSKVFCTKDCKIPLNLKLRVMLNDVVYLVVFELDRIIPMNLLNEALYDETLEVPEYCVEVLKAVFRYQPSYHFYVVGQSYFSRQNCMTLSAGAECWSGYHHSVQVGSGKTLLNLDISATTFIEAVNMVKLFFEVVGKQIDNVAETDRSKFEKFVKGVKFSINHRGPMKRKYRVTGITKQSAEALTFQPNPEHPDEITVKDYFQQRYGIALKYSRLPCIKVVTSQENMPNKTIFFPLEVCDVVEGQRHSKKLNEIQTAKMIKQTCQTPERRKENIATGFSAMGYDKDETLKAFGLNINTEMITVSGRVLDAPELSFHPTSQEQHCIPKEGGWNMKNKKFPIGGTLESWIVCQFGCDDKKHYVGNFVKELVGTAISLGVKVLTPEPAILNFPSLLALLELNLKVICLKLDEVTFRWHGLLWASR